MKIRPSALIFSSDDKVLTLKYNYNGQFLNAIPGGNLEENENIKDTLIRELEEELQIQIQVNEIVAIAETYNNVKKSKVLHLVFKATIVNGIPIPNPKETTTLGVEWVSKEEILQKNLYPNVCESIINIFEGTESEIYLGNILQKWI
ncbi:MAG: NUDIX hydrolase [Cytophagales bacterium]